MDYPKTQPEREQMTADFRDKSRNIARRIDRRDGRLTPKALTIIADNIDRATALRHNEPESRLSELLPTAPVLNFATAERLRALGESLEAREMDTVERLAKAGEQAAEAQQLADRLRNHIGIVTHAADLLDAELTEKEVLLNEAGWEIAELVVQVFQLRDMLEDEQRANRIANRTIAHLLEELDDAKQPVEVVFQFAEAGEGVDVDDAADMALALILDQGASDSLN